MGFFVINKGKAGQCWQGLFHESNPNMPELDVRVAELFEVIHEQPEEKSELVEMIQTCVITMTKILRKTWLAPWGPTSEPPMILLAIPSLRQALMTNNYIFVYFTHKSCCILRNPFFIVPIFYLYFFFYFKIFSLFFPLPSSFFFLWLPLMLLSYSSLASFIPHLTCDDPDISMIFCSHLILLTLVWYFT